MSGSWPAAAGGGSSICDATITATAATAAGQEAAVDHLDVLRRHARARRRSRRARARTARGPRPRSASHAVISPVNQFRNRLTSRSRAPSVTSSGPASSLRVIDPPLSGCRAHISARRPDGPPSPRRPQEEGPPGSGTAQRVIVSVRVSGAPSSRASATVMRSDVGFFALIALRTFLVGFSAHGRRVLPAAHVERRCGRGRGSVRPSLRAVALRRPQPGRGRAVGPARRGDLQRRACGTCASDGTDSVRSARLGRRPRRGCAARRPPAARRHRDRDRRRAGLAARIGRGDRRRVGARPRRTCARPSAGRLAAVAEVPHVRDRVTVRIVARRAEVDLQRRGARRRVGGRSATVGAWLPAGLPTVIATVSVAVLPAAVRRRHRGGEHAVARVRRAAPGARRPRRTRRRTSHRYVSASPSGSVPGRA